MKGNQGCMACSSYGDQHGQEQTHTAVSSRALLHTGKTLDETQIAVFFIKEGDLDQIL